jgi:transposase IS116/IS110/IS902 family protein
VPSLDERANRERLRRRAHLIRLRTSAINRTFGLLTQWGLRRNLTALRKRAAIDELADHGVPEVWQQSISTLLGVIDDLDTQLAPLELELRPHARADPRVKLLTTIPGVAELLGLTLASEIGDIARFPTAKKLVGYSGLTPTIKQSGQSSRTGRISKAGPATLRWAAVEAAQQAWRPNSPSTGSTPTPSTATARPTPPRPPSRARSSSPPGTSSPAKNRSSQAPPPHDGRRSGPGKLLHSSGPTRPTNDLWLVGRRYLSAASMGPLFDEREPASSSPAAP